MYLLTIFKQVLQGSASTVEHGEKDEAGGWCSDPQLFWMRPVSGREPCAHFHEITFCKSRAL